jgi:hypothetical protein
MLSHKNVACPGGFFLSMTLTPAEILYHCSRLSTYNLQQLKTNCCQQKIPTVNSTDKQLHQLCSTFVLTYLFKTYFALRHYVNEEVVKWISQFSEAFSFLQKIGVHLSCPWFWKFCCLTSLHLLAHCVTAVVSSNTINIHRL